MLEKIFMLFVSGWIVTAFLRSNCSSKLKDDEKWAGTAKPGPNNHNSDITRLQQERQKRLSDYCRVKYDKKMTDHEESTTGDTFEQHSQYNSMVYSHNAKSTYCIVPKAASTNWKKIFEIFDGTLTEDEARNMKKNKFHERAYKHLNTLRPPTLREHVRNTYFSFVVTRHPFERLLAAYRDKFQQPKTDLYLVRYGDQIRQKSSEYGRRLIEYVPIQKTIKNLLKPNPVLGVLKKRGGRKLNTTSVINNQEEADKEKEDNRRITFRDFVKYVTTTEPGEYDEHWALQTRLCQPCLKGFKYLASMDTLGEDGRHILHSINQDNKLGFFENLTDRHRVKTRDLTELYYSSISKSDVLRLYQIYKDDFLAFGYKMPDFLL